ncbi:MAG TPA: TIGR03936 family radical SAM-associated protein [Thermoclostridium sp.]|nr:TIGR03936 family radical SAM-associated protein [Thermoclostridium sp.]
MNIRFQFKRGEELKFISHLDIMRVFERAFKRTSIPVSHSQGFNPRPTIVFAQPMPVGLSSDGEFADVELEKTYEIDEFIEKVNANLPEGIRILEAKEKFVKTKIMGIVKAALYKIDFEISPYTDIEKIISSVLDQKKIMVLKRTKSGEKEFDIRPLIYELSGDFDTNAGSFNVLLGAGQNDNVRPELFIDGVNNCTGASIEMLRMHRIMLYGGSGNLWLPLLDERFL